jgi:5'-nucleotidase/UDP-sugar diphosphatase
MKTAKRFDSLRREVLPIALILIFWAGLASPLFSESLILVHSSDIHGHYKPYRIQVAGQERLVGGMEALSHYVQEIRRLEKNVLLIDKGDLLTGTLASDLKYQKVTGGAMMEFLNRVGYDVWSYGNHDFDGGQQNAAGLARLARFPTVMSNIIYKKNRKLFPAEPYHIFALGPLRVGVIGVMEENFLTEVDPRAVEGLEVLPMEATLKNDLPRLKGQADLVIVIAHCPFAAAESIARDIPGIHVILTASNEEKFAVVNGVLIQSTLGYQQALGYLKLEVDKDRVTRYEQKLIWLWADIDLKPSPAVSALVKEVDDSISAEFAKIIGTAKSDHKRSYYPHENERVESRLGDWITDVIRWKTGAQIGLHNSGAIRADIKAGPVTKADVFDVAPFHNRLVVFKLTARQIKDILEKDVERGWDRLQVSGLKYRYYPPTAKPFGQRVDHIEVDGEALENQGLLLQPDRVYTVVSNDYLAGQAKDKYFGFAIEGAKATGISLYESLIDWFRENRVLDYRLQDRIIEIQ